MPNWVTNRLKIYGPSETVKEITALIAGKENAVNFETLKPMPPILHTIHSGATTIDGQNVSNWALEDYGPCERCGGSGEIMKKQASQTLTPCPSCHQHKGRKVKPRLLNMEEKCAIVIYGDWYQWTHANWGTKWNACKSRREEVDLGEAEGHVTELEVTFVFSTAWSMPWGWLKDLFIYCPKDAHIVLEYADEDVGFNCGRVAWEHGELFEWNPVFGTREAARFACSVRDVDFDDYEAEYEPQ